MTTIESMLAAKRIVVVGITEASHKPSCYVPQYLISVGYEIVGVNPNLTTALGQPCYPSLEQVPGPINLVNIFRRPEFIPAIVQSAIQAHAAGVWVQSGIRSPEALALAKAANLSYIEDHCIMIEHRRRH